MPGVITHSLIDRLIDNDPEQAIEPAEGEKVALARYKASLRRDLEALLNSKRPQLAGLERHPVLGESVIGYGLQDITTEDFAAAGVRDRTRRMIAQAIREHETRLTNIEVDMDDAPTSRGVRLRISAVLTLTQRGDTVIYEASVRPSDRTIQVALAS